MRQPDRTKSANPGGRKKLEPDPQVRGAILAVASEVVREYGVGALSIARVLNRAQLSTRAFYRHFGSKNELVAALFLEMANVETLRLRQTMEAAPDPIRAVAAWIDGRLELVFNEEVRSDLRKMSLEAQSQMLAAPELVKPAYDEILRPLVEQLGRGGDLGLFADIDPANDALSIQGVVWSNVEQQWTDVGCTMSELRHRVQRFCLRGLGVTPDTIADVLSEGPRAELLTRKT